ncbi:hypothetical protein [Rhodococcus rhodochrous]|uniref:hypothetical protein n=1 Tax=Rhodococcus rhodochrous TaxID=1829 RepID=UPI0002FD21C8|nr:hypothetical protein [Rhodococcus rhodochrous]
MTIDDMYTRIAAAVVTEAGMIDYRIRRDLDGPDKINGQIEAWARVFRDQPVWPHEAQQAVLAHYRKPNPFQIMPGDVIEYCRQQPITSSPEHVAWFYEMQSAHPWSRAIQELLGREIPELDPMNYDNRDEAFLVQARKEFLAANGKALVAEAMANAERKAITS